jgi:cell division protein FtsA
MELLALIRDDLRRAGLETQIPAGFVLCGGGARLHGFDELIEQSLHLPVRVAQPKGLADLPELVAQPDYATVIGLVMYGAKARRSSPQRAGNLVSKLKAMFAGAS